MGKIFLVRCDKYIEDPCICDSTGETKGQCVNCGAKWYEHNLSVLSGEDYDSAKQIQFERGIINKRNYYNLSSFQWDSLLSEERKQKICEWVNNLEENEFEMLKDLLTDSYKSGEQDSKSE